MADEISCKEERHPLGKTFCSKYHMMADCKLPGKGLLSSVVPGIIFILLDFCGTSCANESCTRKNKSPVSCLC